MTFDLDLMFSKFTSKVLMCRYSVVAMKIVEKRKKKRGKKGEKMREARDGFKSSTRAKRYTRMDTA